MLLFSLPPASPCPHAVPKQHNWGGGKTLQVYNEHKPRLAVSGWFHGALESEMGDWPECAFDAANGKSGGAEGEGEGGGDGGVAASTLEQLKGGTEGGDGDGDGSSLGVSFKDDFVGTEVRKEVLKHRTFLKRRKTFGGDR